jgi:hypothetical protein
LFAFCAPVPPVGRGVSGSPFSRFSPLCVGWRLRLCSCSPPSPILCRSSGISPGSARSAVLAARLCLFPLVLSSSSPCCLFCVFFVCSGLALARPRCCVVPCPSSHLFPSCAPCSRCSSPASGFLSPLSPLRVSL